MPTQIKIDGSYAVERSSYLIRLDIFDEDDQPVEPKTGTWTLTNEAGTVIINEREDVVLSPLADIMYVLLTNEDLALTAAFAGVSENRVFLFQGTYDSQYGSDNHLRDQLVFPVVNLAAITA